MKAIIEDQNSDMEPFEDDLFQSADGMMLGGLDGKVILINDVARKFWNLDNSCKQGTDLIKVMEAASLLSRDPKSFMDGVVRTLSSKNRVVRIEFPLVNGRVMDCHTFPMIGADNKIHGRIWYTRDITEQKRVQDLRNLQHLMMENLAEGIVLETAHDGKIVYANKRFEKIFGYKRNELLDKYICILNSKDNKLPPRKLSKMINQSVKNGGEWEGVIKNVKKDGTEIWTNVKTVAINHSQYGEVCVSIQSDVTDKLKADNLLMESEKRYRVLFEYSQEAIVFITKDGIFLDANPAAQKLTGYSLGELKKIGRKGLIDPADNRIDKLLEFRDKYAYYKGHFRIIRRDGKKIECEAASVVFKDKNGYEQTHVVLREVGV